MQVRGTRRLVVAACALLLVAAACGNESSPDGKSSGDTSDGGTTVDQPGVTKDTIRTAGVASITNALNAPYGDIFKGVKAYYAKVNAEGGIYGRDLELVNERDDQMSNNLKEVQGILSEDDAFAAVGILTIFDFSGATELEKAGIPSFGVNYNADWNKQNLFSNAGALCLGCTGADVPWMAKELDKKTIGILTYGSVDSSKRCGEGLRDSFEEFPSAEVGYYSDGHSFGDVDYSVDVQKMKEAGVDFVTTCFDANAVLALGKEMRAQNLDATQYLPNAYDHEFIDANSEFFQDSIVRVPFVPFETSPQPKGLAEYLKWMKKQGDTPNEYSTYGWINAAQLVEGLKGAGPNFTQAKVVAALNKLKKDTGGGLLPGIDWTTQHTETHPPEGCAAFVKVEGKKFVPAFVPKGKAFLCWPDKATLSTEPTAK
jgi:ABC-type branched-subunit amino acid transport system substrate-binding protein